MGDDERTEIVKLTQRLLDSIAAGDWETYRSLCDPSLSAFEPEARGHLVEGLAFHKFYFDLGKEQTPRSNTICSPHVRLLGPDAAVISYIRIVQYLDSSGVPHSACSEETRVWYRQDGRWQHVHFHRSANA
jgi:calcium/calmodulin-dependent protein kinase (CaM kinase) II